MSNTSPPWREYPEHRKPLTSVTPHRRHPIVTFLLPKPAKLARAERKTKSYPKEYMAGYYLRCPQGDVVEYMANLKIDMADDPIRTETVKLNIK